MKLKHLIILVIVFVCLVTVIFMKKNITPETPKEEVFREMIQPLISLGVVNECDIVLRHAPDSAGKKTTELKFKKENGVWVLENVHNARVKEKELETFLEKLDNMKGELRSDKKELFEDYGITDEESVHIILRGTDGAEITHLVIGTKKPDWGHNFVRDAGATEVYIADKNILALLGFWEDVIPEKFDKKRWINLDMVDFDPGEIVSVKITEETAAREENILDITRKTSGDKKEWIASKDYLFSLNSDKVREFLKTIKRTEATGIADPQKTEHFGSSDWVLTLGIADGKKIVLTRGIKRADGAYYFKVSGNDHAFLIADATFNEFDKRDADFFAKNPFDLTEETIKELKVRDIKKRKTFTAIKSSETSEWKTKKGAVIDTAKIKDVIEILKNISIEIFPEAKVPKKNILTYEITKTDGRTRNFAISKETTIDGKQYYGLKIETVPSQYYIESDTLKKLKVSFSNLS